MEGTADVFFPSFPFFLYTIVRDWKITSNALCGYNDHTMKSEMANLYSRVASTYGGVGPPVFSHFGRRLVELAQISSEAKVLDAGTGRGAILFPAAEKVGPRGRVIGVDLSEGMIGEISANINRKDLKHAMILQMDAEHLGFRDATFNNVLSGFTILLFTRALLEFYRVLRPGGRIAISLAAYGGDERFRWYNELVLTYSKMYQFRTAPRVDVIREPTREPDALTAILAESGFVENHVIAEELEFIYADAEEWWASKCTHGARYPLERMEPKILDRFKSEVFAKLQPLKQPDGLHERWPMLFILGTKPHD